MDLFTKLYLSERERVVSLIREYERLPRGEGFIASSIMRATIRLGDGALKRKNLITLFVAYQVLQRYEAPEPEETEQIE